MPQNSMTVRENSTFPPLSCSPDEQPPVTMSNAALEALHQEREDARRAWVNALVAIPGRPGRRRDNAILKATRLRERYELLTGLKAK